LVIALACRACYFQECFTILGAMQYWAGSVNKKNNKKQSACTPKKKKKNEKKVNE